jgi:hypothetical protein
MTSGPDDLVLGRAMLALEARAAALEARETAEKSRVSVLDGWDWHAWLGAMVPGLRGFSPFHEDFWNFVWSIDAEGSADPFVGVWARGSGKSTSVESASLALGLRGMRRYVWYVRSTQDAADDSVGTNIAHLLESPRVEKYYPWHAERQLSKYGHSKGWNSQRLRTAGGFTVDGIGLDTAARGLKVEDQRPDLIVLDDVDGKFDTPRTTKKKLDTITTSILPAGSAKTVVIGIQNLIIPHGVFSRLVDGRADFLATRKVSGPVPAVRGLKTEIREDEEAGRRRAFIVAGTPTWEGQDLATCQKLIDNLGLGAFLKECQHEVRKREGALWTDDMLAHRIDAAPRLKRVAVGVDPSGGGDAIGIVVAGLGYDGRGYVLADLTQDGARGPLNWGKAAVRCYLDHEADRIVAEKNFGGDMVESNIQVAAQALDAGRVPVTMVHASRGKDVRAEPVAALYENGLISHVGTFPELEAELTGWVPGDPDSPNRLDACFVAGTRVMTGQGEVPIEQIQIGDAVWTRAGWRPVLHCGRTSAETEVLTVHLSDGRALTGTGNHPIWVEGKGWAALDTLVWGDILLSCTRDEIPSSSKVSYTPDSLTPPSGHRGSISSRLAAVVERCSTGKCGKRITGRSRRVHTSIIGTKIPSITIRRIWNALTRRPMRSAMRVSTSTPAAHGLSVSALSPQSGTAHPRGSRGMLNTVNALGRVESPTRSHAAIAGSARSDSKRAVKLAFAAAIAPELPPIPSADTSERRLAPSARSSSGRTSTVQSLARAPVSVLGFSESEKAAVYNLEVAEHPEYFANGILVHNCVWVLSELMLGSAQKIFDIWYPGMKSTDAKEGVA